MTKPGNEADAAAARLQALVDAHHGWAIDYDMREVVADAWTALSHALSIARGATVEMRGQAGPELNEQDDDA